jgi:hypothetical protein
MPAGPVIDGHTANAGYYDSTTISLTLTTSLSNDWIFVFVYNESQPQSVSRSVSLVAGGGLTWHQRGSIQSSLGDYCSVDIWYAFAASPLSAAVITVTFSGPGDDYAAVACGINNSGTSTPFDTAPGLPAHAAVASGTVTVSFSTVAANCLGLAFCGSVNNSVAAIPGGWALVDSAHTNAGGLDAGAALWSIAFPLPQGGASVTASPLGGGVLMAVDVIAPPATAGGGSAPIILSMM